MAEAILVSAAFLARHGEALERVAPGVPRAVLGERGLEGRHEAVRIAFFSADCFGAAYAREFMIAALKSPKLEWLHTASAGVDHEVFQRFLARGVRLTTSSGAHAVPIAHTVLLYLLALSRDLPRWLEAQRARRWEPRALHDLQGDRLGVVGLGPIGLEVARLGLALGMRVTGLRRTSRGDEPCETWPLSRLGELLPLVDWLVLALPLTRETRHLLDARALALLKPTARLVNVGRGSLVDEAALMEALREGRLAGAALDVFEVEPLPEGSPLWELPNVILTPHSSGSTPGNDERAAALFLENLARFRAGEKRGGPVAPGLAGSGGGPCRASAFALISLHGRRWAPARARAGERREPAEPLRAPPLRGRAPRRRARRRAPRPHRLPARPLARGDRLEREPGRGLRGEPQPLPGL
jgi:phosphoglycerate dehydrogenase-like enzyme